MFGPATYFVLLTIWAVPVIALHWFVGGQVLWRERRSVSLATLLGGGYLALADRVALGDGIWEINPARSTGLKLSGLPIEELVFFLVTSLLVAQSVTLLLARDLTLAQVWQRFRAVPGNMFGRRYSILAAYRVGLGWGSGGALLGSAIALLQGDNSPFTTPALVVMDLTPLPIATWLLEELGPDAVAAGLVGGFALYLLGAGVIAVLARGGWSGGLLATTVAGLVALWLGTGSSSLAGLVVAAAPFLGAWLPPSGRRGRLVGGSDVSTLGALARSPGQTTRRRLLAVAPAVAAILLAGLWGVGRAAREGWSRGSGAFLFTPPPVLPRDGAFPVAGQASEVTPRTEFYVVSKNLEDPGIDALSWRLQVTGDVAQPTAIDLPTLLAWPRTDQYVTLQCVSNPVGGSLIGNALWSGVLLSDVLAAAGPSPTATWIRFEGRDGHFETLPRGPLEAEGALIAYAMNGDLLDRRHGFPARLIAPGRYGFKHVKWLQSIELLREEAAGYWSGRGWTLLAEMRTGARIEVARVDGLVAGTAVAGGRGIRRVEVRYRGADGPGPWLPGQLHQPPLGSATWVQWRAQLPEMKGDTVEVRAWDNAGVVQIEDDHAAFPHGASGLHRRHLST